MKRWSNLPIILTFLSIICLEEQIALNIRNELWIAVASKAFLYPENPAIVAGFNKGFADEQKTNKNQRRMSL